MTLTKEAKLNDTLGYLWNELDEIGGLKEYVIFGSTGLIMRGILDRVPGDIDMFVTKKVWGALLARKDWHVETPKAGDPPILVNNQTPIMIHAFFDWSDEAADMDVPLLLDTKQWIWYRNWAYSVVTVEEALRVKELAIANGAKADKHIPDVEIIKEWLSESRNKPQDNHL